MKRAILVVLAGGLLASPAQGADLPKRSPGLWEEQFSSSAMPGAASTNRICVDDKLADFLRSKGNCSKEEVRPEGNGYVVEAVCKQGDTTIRSRTVVTGDLNRAYTAEISATQEPAPPELRQARMVVKARHLGACPAGMRGGEMIAPDGSKFNFYDLEKNVLPK